MKNLSIIVLLATVGLFAQSKPEFSLSIRAEESTVKAGSGVVLTVKKTNLTNHVLLIGGGINPAGVYTFDVRRDGVLTAEGEEAKRLRQLREHPREITGGSAINAALQPQGTETDTVGVSAYRDMSQPGKYTIQLQQGRVKSNIVTVTVEP